MVSKFRQVFAVAGFPRLLFTFAFNQVAWTMGLIVLAVVVYRHTGSAAGSMAFFLCGQFVPALGSPTLVARFGRRSPGRALGTLYAIEGAAFLLLAWLAGHFSLVPMLLVVVVDGLAASTARAIARSTTAELLNPGGLLRDGNALINAIWSVAFMTGPALGGVVVALGGTTAVLVANAALFGAMAMAVATSTDLRDLSPIKEQPRDAVFAAARYAWEQRRVATLIGLQGVALVFFTMSTPVEVVLAQHTLHAGPSGYGSLVALWGAGAVAGSAVYARWRNAASRALLTVAACVIGIGFGVMAAAPSIGIALAGAAIAGSGNAVQIGAAITALQEHVEQAHMALVMSLDNSVAQLTPGVGIVLGGVIATISSPRVALAIASAGALVIAGGTLWIFRPSGSLALVEGGTPALPGAAAPAA